MQHSFDKKLDIGRPGGYDCPCCGPGKGYVGRGRVTQKLRRTKRKQLKRELFRHEQVAN